MMRRRSLLRIDDSSSRRRRVALQQRTSITARAGSPSIDLIDITPELTGSPTLCGSRTFFGIAAKSRIPLVELVSEFFIQHSRPYLQEQMGAATTPAHLLLFDESLA